MSNKNKPVPKIIFEVGCNHKGSIDTAKEMIKLQLNFVM